MKWYVWKSRVTGNWCSMKTSSMEAAKEWDRSFGSADRFDGRPVELRRQSFEHALRTAGPLVMVLR